MARNREKYKNRKIEGGFCAIPHAVIESSNLKNASGNAIKLLTVMVRAYNGKNNGDLCAAFSVMKIYGWTSQATLDWGLKELLHYGFIEKTRQGDLTKKPSLYAITWQPIDQLGEKLELCGPSTVASGKWKNPVTAFKRSAVVKNKRGTRRIKND